MSAGECTIRLVALLVFRRAYLVAAPVWAAMLPAATYAATRVHASTPTQAFALAVYAVGSLVCHQLPERSFHAWGAHLPVCARCTGIYLGAATAVARRLQPSVRAGGWRSPRGVALLAALPTVATLVFEWTTGLTPSNAVRFAAGLPLGAVVSWLVVQVN
jgi:uncharacterized membrane protein